MKRTIIILAGLFFISVFLNEVKAQSAVYFCSQTGAYGFAFGLPKDEVLSEAKDACIRLGGIEPKLIAFTENGGYGAIALGIDEDGDRVIGVAIGFSYLETAKSKAINACKEFGGLNPKIEDSFHDIK